MKELWSSINKFYFSNIMLVATIFCSIIIMFTVQFKVEALQDEMSQAESDIVEYEDQIKLLEVEWVYLTRPERLRTLANIYLKYNGYTLASQIKETEKLEKYYLAIYQNSEAEEVAANPENKDPQQVSF